MFARPTAPLTTTAVQERWLAPAATAVGLSESPEMKPSSTPVPSSFARPIEPPSAFAQ
jgi:hypothetical protein